jgi:hypothetical protein
MYCEMRRIASNHAANLRATEEKTMEHSSGSEAKKHLEQLTDELNAALALAELRLRDKHPGCMASVPLDAEIDLWWKKHDGRWGLFVEDHNGNLHPLGKASRAYRIEAASRLQDLYETLLAVQSGEEQRVLAAIELAEKFIP